MFDLPKDLDVQRPSNPGNFDQQPGWTAVTSQSAGEMPSSNTQTQSPQDWTFLRGFGDPTDEFYELDVQLRGLLDGGSDFTAFDFDV